MKNRSLKTEDKGFTQDEQDTLYGFSRKIAAKRRCSGMYVRYIIKGERGTGSALAKAIISDLNALLLLLRPEK